MEALKIIKRIVSYGVFIVAATLFLLNSVTVSLAPYIDISTAYDNSFVPFMYVVLSLGVMLLFQLLIIGKPKEIETTIYPWLLIVFFAVMLFTSSLVLGKAVVACSSDKSMNVSYSIAGMIPSILISVIEIVVGVFLLFKKNKTSTETSTTDENGVNLTKEE